MKKFSIIILVCCLTVPAFAQNSKKETFKVSGNCGMCKNKIEKAAKTAGATYAVWNTETKDLTVKYNSTSANAAKIQKAIAGVGYDTPGFKATKEAYNKLHECCKYERNSEEMKCCDGEKCGKGEDCCAGMDCCKDGKCIMQHEDSNNAKAMDCCKDGKCTKEGHSGKDCCKKS